MNYIIVNKNINGNNIKGIGINIPFNGNTGISTTFNTKDSIRINLLNFLLTNNRERILNPTMGSGIRNELFENISEGNISDIKTLIVSNINNNFSDIKLDSVIINTEGNQLLIYIKYSIINTNIQDDIQIKFNNDN